MRNEYKNKIVGELKMMTEHDKKVLTCKILIVTFILWVIFVITLNIWWGYWCYNNMDQLIAWGLI